MALRATIYKAELHVADNDRAYYGSHALTIARHPSETDERMMVRLLAFALHADESLAFTRGLSEVDEPDVWRKNLTGGIDLWIEVGQPDERRLLKACARAGEVVVYCYGHASGLWWDGLRGRLERVRNLRVLSLPPAQAQALGALARRGMKVHANVQDGEIYLSTEDGEVVVQPQAWR